MRITKRLVQGSVLIAGALGAVAVGAPESRPGRAARRLADRLSRDLRYVTAATPGLLYRLAGRHPDDSVTDDVLVDRVRSSIGPLLKKLDLPRIHVMAENHVVMLHGDVAHEWEAERIEHAIARIAGVEDVESHLHVGLVEGDTRPSQGRGETQAPSAALQQLLTAAVGAGATDPRAAVRAVLGRFLTRLPGDERDQVLGHLPADVRELVGSPRRPETSRSPRKFSLDDLVTEVEAQGVVDPSRTRPLVSTMIVNLREVAEDEAEDVGAVLPADLRDVWLADAPR
jgi:uncharacterized protein (DUF2267 family)